MKLIKLTDEHHAAISKLAAETHIGKSEALSLIIDDWAKQGSQIPVSDGPHDLTIDEKTKLAKLIHLELQIKMLELEVRIKRVVVERTETGASPAVKAKVAIETSARDGIATVGEPRPRPKATFEGGKWSFAQEESSDPIRCFEVSCEVSWDPPSKEARRNHMVEVHGWTSTMLENIGGAF